MNDCKENNLNDFWSDLGKVFTQGSGKDLQPYPLPVVSGVSNDIVSLLTNPVVIILGAAIIYLLMKKD